MLTSVLITFDRERRNVTRHRFSTVINVLIGFHLVVNNLKTI